MVLTRGPSLVTIRPVEEVAERFLEEETANPVSGIAAAERNRFHRLVRQCAANWLLHPKAGLRINRGRSSLVLQFDGPLGGKPIAVFVLKVGYETRDYRFIGPNPDRKKLGLQPTQVVALDRLRDLYDAFLADKVGNTREHVISILRGERLPDLVPLVEETRRALDGGQETSPPISTFPITVKKKAPLPLTISGQRSVVGLPAHQNAPTPIRVLVDPHAFAQRKPVPVKPATLSAPKRPTTVPEPQKVTRTSEKSPTSTVVAQKSTKTVERPTAGTPSPKAVAPSPEKKEPVLSPALLTIKLSCKSPRTSAEFHARLFQSKPVRKSKDGALYEVALGPVTLVLQEDLTKEDRAAFGLGTVDRNRGWGAMMEIRVPDFELCLRRARKMNGVLVREGTGGQSFVVRDPSGFLFEVVPASSA